MDKLCLLIGAMFGGLAVMAGAFGAHGLEERLSPELMEVWKTAATYQMYHAIAMLFVGLWARLDRGAKPQAAVGVCFTIGTLIFSGTLYLLAVTGVKWLGAITPIGGVLLIVGWGLLARAGWKAARCPR
jgi:uncharacterized membrane protein YgdD (TMEM256/DUF423 family)